MKHPARKKPPFRPEIPKCRVAFRKKDRPWQYLVIPVDGALIGRVEMVRPREMRG